MTDLARRVLYVEGNVDSTIGGSYFSLLFLVSGLDRSRYEPVVVFAAENAMAPRFRARGITTLVRPLAPAATFAGPFGSLVSKAVTFARWWLMEPPRLAKLLRRERIALVHLNNGIQRNHSWMLAARLAGIPCITHERGISARYSLLSRWLAGRLAAVVCISGAVRDNLVRAGLGGLPLALIHNGLDPSEMRVTRTPRSIRAELGISEQARVVGIVGNIKAWKGQEVVVRALAALRDEFPDLVCLLIGDTSPNDAAYRARLIGVIEEGGLSGRVLITGFRSDVANYVAALDIQIHASVAPEPFGRVLLEAMALGKPLVASRGGAVPEIVIDGETGLLFEPGRSDALARCLRELLNDPARAARLADAGRRRLEAEFSITRNVERTESVYGSLFGRQRFPLPAVPRRPRSPAAAWPADEGDDLRRMPTFTVQGGGARRD